MTTQTEPTSLQMTWRFQLALLGSIAFFLVISNWPTIRNSTFEVGDFAANSLLIQDAKSFSLFVGNYSRIGFNHPGPAILYVLAAGEWLFHDVLHIVKHPISGQLIAVAIYNACWLLAILRMLIRLTGSRAEGALATAVFAFAAVLCDADFFTGLWFPQLYFLPFATFLLAAARLAARHTDSWLALAVSSGFLINGHVSFVAIIGLIVIIILIRSFLQSLRDPRAPFLLSKSFLGVHRTRAVYCLGVASLFFVPLLIETVLRFPGPISDYIHFSGGDKHNSVLAAIAFTGYYWGSVLAMFTGLTLLIVLAVHMNSEAQPYAENIRSLVAVLFAATFALWFYAYYGVDFLDQKYIGLFYFATPAIALSLAASYAYRHLKYSRKQILAGILMLLCVIGIYHRISRPAPYANFYNHPEVADLYLSLNALDRRGRLVLDLDNTNWGEVWSNSAGLMAYAKRQGNDLVCVNKNWHILFSRANLCTPAEVANGTRLLVYSTTANEDVSETLLVQSSGLSFYAFALPEVAGQGYVPVASHQNWFRNHLLTQGWSPTEGEFVWTQERKAYMSIPINPKFNGTLILDLAAFIPAPDSQQHVTVAINGKRYPPIRFDAANNRKTLRFDVTASGKENLEIELDIENPLSPSDFGSGDTRELGVALYGLQVESR